MEQGKLRTSFLPAWVPYAATAVLVTAFLFFIDEGRYNFSWMADPGNWFVFLLYAFPVFSCQLLFSRVLLRRRQGRSKMWWSMAGGITVAPALTILLFSCFS